MDKQVKINFTFIIHELILPSGNYVHDAEFETEGIISDEGIGHYEFWGKTGTDVQIIYQADEIAYTGETHKEEVEQYIKDNWAELDRIADNHAYDNGYFDEY